MTQDLRYPIGNFSAPSEISDSEVQQAIQKVKEIPKHLASAIEGLSEEQLDTPYRPEGWTVRQLIHHVADSHMNAYIRFHWTLTEESPKIKAYNEKAWAELPYMKTLSTDVSLQLLTNLHQRWSTLLESLTQADLEKYYIHPEGDKIYALKKVVLLYAWHGEHHTAHITALRKRMDW